MKSIAPFLIIVAIVVAIVIVLILNPIAMVDSGSVGLVRTFGKIDQRTLDPGISFINPMSDVINYRVSESKASDDYGKELTTAAYTLDNQPITIFYDIHYSKSRPDAAYLYIRYGSTPITYVKSLVDTSIKEVIGRYTATETITKREKIVDDILISAQASVKDDQGKDIVLLQKIPVPNIEMSKAYEDAVEAKQIAMQQAEKARYDLQKAKTEADMKLAAAKADAESMKIKTEALAKSQSLVQYEYVKALEEFAKKWNGQVPQTLFMGNQGKQNLWIPIGTPGGK